MCSLTAAEATFSLFLTGLKTRGFQARSSLLDEQPFGATLPPQCLP